MFTATKEQMKTVGLYQSLIPQISIRLFLSILLSPPLRFFLAVPYWRWTMVSVELPAWKM